MTAEDKKRELCRYRLLMQRIERKEQERQRWLDTGTKALVSERPKSINAVNKAEQAGAACAQIAGELAQEICELALAKRKIEQDIRGIEDEKQRLILEKRYIDGLTFERIAEDMDYDSRWIRRLHKKAIEELALLSPQ